MHTFSFDSYDMYIVKRSIIIKEDIWNYYLEYLFRNDNTSKERPTYLEREGIYNSDWRKGKQRKEYMIKRIAISNLDSNA